jgi:hypothetical protein
MNVRRPIFSGIALCTSLLLAVPANVGAQAAQPAGKITTVLPIVNVVRAAQQIPANASQEVFWGDVINTGHLARARVGLNDGSVLSVGSDSNLEITKHDAAEQQTDLELNYGRVRANAVKLVKPKGSFQIRTPSGVAGVVGTDFEISTENDTTRIVVFEGKVRFCALVSEEKKKEGEQEPGVEEQVPAPNVQEPGGDDQDQQKKRKRRVFLGPCVIVAAGAASNVHFNSAPSQPVPATPLTVTEAVNATSPTGGAGAGAGAAGAGGAAGGGVGAAGGAIVGVSAGIAATVATVVVRSVATTKTCAPPPPAGGAAPRANCVKKAGVSRLPGQR